MPRVRSHVRPLAFLAVLALVSCAPVAPAETSPSPAAAVATSTAVPSATPTPAPTRPVIWPLRGTIAPNADAVRRRPVLVRIPDDVGARPQSGLAKADMVWELLAEGGITRYMAVYQSEEADLVGPIRSARLSDLHYAPMLHGILAHVGASTIVLQRVRAAAATGEFVDVDQFLFGSYYDRVSFRVSPQNVYTSTERLRAAAKTAGDSGVADVPSLPFAVCGQDCATGTNVSSFTLPYLGAMRETYTYDPGVNGYRRAQGGAPTIDAATSAPIVATNVVVIFTDVTPQPGIVEDSLGSLSLDIRTTGSGPVSVFTGDGVRRDGTWSRQSGGMYSFTVAGGAKLTLWPGQTWVHVVPSDWTITSAP